MRADAGDEDHAVERRDTAEERRFPRCFSAGPMDFFHRFLGGGRLRLRGRRQRDGGRDGGGLGEKFSAVRFHRCLLFVFRSSFFVYLNTGFDKPLRSYTTLPSRSVSSQTIFCVPFNRTPGPSTNPKLPFSIRQTATSAPAPIDRCPSVS